MIFHSQQSKQFHSNGQMFPKYAIGNLLFTLLIVLSIQQSFEWIIMRYIDQSDITKSVNMFFLFQNLKL